MKKIILLSSFLVITSLLFSQNPYVTTAPVQDGNITAAEYGNCNSGPWYMAWDATNLYIAKTGGATGEPDILYFSMSPNSSANGGVANGSNGQTTGKSDWNVTPNLPFTANARIYWTSSYAEVVINTGSGWGSAITSGLVYNTGSTSREIKIPWSVINNGGGLPSAFNWLGTASSTPSSGPGYIYDQFPTANYSGNGSGTPTYNFYQTVDATANGSATNPCSASRESYTNYNNTAYSYTSTLPATLFDFTLGNSSKSGTTTIKSSITVGRDVVVENGTLNANGAVTISMTNTAGNFYCFTTAGGHVFGTDNGTGNDLYLQVNTGANINFGGNAGTANSDDHKFFTITVQSGATLTLSKGILARYGNFNCAGTLQINSGGYVQGAAETSATPVAYSGSSNLIYNNGGPYTSTDYEWPTTSSPANVTIQNSGTDVTLNDAKTISGALTISSGAELDVSGSNFGLSVGGNWTNNGTFAPETGTVTFNGSGSAQTLSGTTTFNNLTFSNSSGLSLAGAISVNGTLTFPSSGLITTSGNTVIMGASATISGASSSAFVNGNLSWTYSAAVSHVFPVGAGAGNYHPATFAYASTPATTIITISDNELSLTGVASIPAAVKLYTARYWTVSQSVTTSANYTIGLDPTGFTLYGTAVILKSDNGAAASQNAATTPNYTNATAFTTIGNGASYFGLGNINIPLTITGVTANNKTYDGTKAATLNTGSAALSGVISPDVVNLVSSGATGTFATANAGSGIAVTASGFTLSGAQAAYYSLTQPTGLTGTINQASLTITPNNITKCSGATYTFAGTEFTTNGLVNGDAVSSVTLTSAGAAASAGVGTYSITASNAVGTGLSNYNISYDIGLLKVESLSLTITQVNPDCYGHPGSLSGSVTGGTTPYMYEVNSGLNYNTGAIVYGPSTDSLYSPVVPGNYTYSVTDAAGCMAIQPGIRVNPLTQTAVLEGVTTAPSTVQICYGNTKTINTVPIGGATPYTYSLNTNGVSGVFVASASRYFSVPAGTYYITVKDNVGCTYNTDTISITQPAAGVSFTTSIGGQACATLGGIYVTASGGYGGYTYSDNGGSSYQSKDTFSGLAYGNYTVSVKDENGCASASAVVKFATLTSSAITASHNPVCSGGTTTINTVPSGGTPPYSYSLDGLAYVPSNARYFEVAAGTHSITVKDNVSCTYTPASITIDSTNCSGLAEGAEGSQKVQSSATMFKAYLSPNPSMASFHLQLQSSSREDVQLVVTNMMGVKVYEAKGGIGDAYEFGSDLKGGMYILQILQGNTVRTVKLVKGN